MKTLTRIGRWMERHPTLMGLVLFLTAIWLNPHALYAAPVLIGTINLDPVNTATTTNIMPGLADDFFKADPLLEFMKNRHHVYPGGPLIRENLLYKPMRGSVYAKGQGGFDISKRQTLLDADGQPLALTAENGAVSGRHLRHGRKPAASAEAADGKNITFLARAGRTGQTGLQ
jgi:hypothetical protein